MYFINIIIKKLSAFQHLKAILFAFRNLPPFPLNLKPKTHYLKPNLGFTLIETLVAISILMIAISSPLTIAQKGVASAIYAKDQIIASYLAQDAIEFIINKSDGNKLSGTGIDWLDGIKNECDIDSACQVDTVKNGGITKCDNNVCDNLKYSDVYHSYSPGSGAPSVFSRSVTVKEVQSGIEALITVKISWNDKSKQRTLTFQTRIFNWKS